MVTLGFHVGLINIAYFLLLDIKTRSLLLQVMFYIYILQLDITMVSLLS